MKLLKMRGKKKKIWPKMEGKKIVAIDLWQWNLPKWEEKKKNYGNEVAKNWGERERENCLNKKKYLEESITSTLPPDSYYPSTLEYILWSFPIKPNLLI